MQITATTIALFKYENGEIVQIVQKHENLKKPASEMQLQEEKLDVWLEYINWRKLEFWTNNVSKKVKERL